MNDRWLWTQPHYCTILVVDTASLLHYPGVPCIDVSKVINTTSSNTSNQLQYKVVKM